MYSYIAGIAVDVIVLFFFFVGAYCLSVAVFSFVPQNRVAPEHRLKKFAVLIPAHNEEKVISNLIYSILSADYKRELIKIYVIADGCTDRTAEIAERQGAFVIKRQTSTCKGDALAYAVSHLLDTDCDADCITVFDADNIVDKFFFKETDERLALGEMAVQGYIDSKNPYASWVSHAHSMWYWITNRIIQTGRAKTGAGARLGGTGFTMRTDVLKKLPWSTSSMAEDEEYTCILAENGILVDFAPRAVVYDEKPESFSESIKQRKRWAKGTGEVQGDFTFRLLKRGRLSAVLGLWQEILGPLSFFVLLFVAIFKVGGIAQTTIGGAAIWFYLALGVLVTIFALAADKKMNLKILFNIFGFLVYIFSWIPIGIAGVFFSNDGWYHTRHGRAKIQKKNM